MLYNPKITQKFLCWTMWVIQETSFLAYTGLREKNVYTIDTFIHLSNEKY